MYLLEQLKLQRLTKPRVGEEVDELEISYSAGRNIKQENHTSNM